MTTPAPSLLGKLSRTKLLTRWQVASVGHGERRSRTKGAGMEFADHREYQPGDDLRYLDPHVYARTGKTYVRQYDVYRQLPITILIDASRSMNYGEPNKFAYAVDLAATLGYVGLAGGDQVQVCVGAGEKLHWSPRYHGALRASRLFEWLDEQKPMSTGTIGQALQLAMRNVTERGLLIVMSDWWADDVEADLKIISASGQELWGVQIAARDELDPSLLGDGEVRMVDVETGHEVELSLDRSTRERYKRSLEAWREQLQSLFAGVKGRLLLAPTDQTTYKLLLQDWRRMGPELGAARQGPNAGTVDEEARDEAKQERDAKLPSLSATGLDDGALHDARREVGHEQADDEGCPGRCPGAEQGQVAQQLVLTVKQNQACEQGRREQGPGGHARHRPPDGHDRAQEARRIEQAEPHRHADLRPLDGGRRLAHFKQIGRLGHGARRGLGRGAHGRRIDGHEHAVLGHLADKGIEFLATDGDARLTAKGLLDLREAARAVEQLAEGELFLAEQQHLAGLRQLYEDLGRALLRAGGFRDHQIGAQPETDRLLPFLTATWPAPRDCHRLLRFCAALSLFGTNPQGFRTNPPGQNRSDPSPPPDGPTQRPLKCVENYRS